MAVPEGYEMVEVPQEQQQQYGVPPGVISGQDKADLLDKIDPSAIVEEIRHRLLGEQMIAGKWEKVPELQERALTKKGAWDIANIMLGVSSQNVAISKLKDNEIRDRTLNIVKTVQYMCLKNWREYGITGSDQLYFIHQIVMSNTFITLKQPEGEGIRKMITSTITENRLQQEQTKQRGGLSNLFRR